MTDPSRTCIGCRHRAAKPELLRLVNHAGQVVVDVHQVEPGRGAYLHRSSECLDLAVRRRAVGRALRVPALDGGELVRLVQSLTSRSPLDRLGEIRVKA